jgi:Flp pilus assembly protein TadD
MGVAAPLLLAAGLAAYHNSFQGAFVLDDLSAIVENRTIRTLFPPWAAFSPPARSAVTGRPVVNLSLAINYALGGLDVTSYHLFNLMIHVLAALVLFGIVRRTLAAAPNLSDGYRAKASEIAVAVGLLWIVHPLTSESVDYVIQRTELLMSLFFLLTIYCALRGFESAERRWHVAALVAFAFGMGSKEVIVVAPAVVLVCDGLFWSRSFKEAVRRHFLLYGGFFVVLALSLLFVATRFRRTFVGFAHPAISPVEYALTESGVIVHYLRLTVWPDALTADYTGWPVAKSIASVLPSLIVCTALIASTIWGLVRRRPLAFLGTWFFLILAPTSSFRPIPNEIAAERRMYLPLAAVVVLAVIAGDALLRRVRAPRPSRAAAVAAVAIALAILTVRRNADYRTTLSFWTDVVTKRPENPRGHIWLGNYLYSHGSVADGIRHLSEAVRLKPSDWSAQYSLGVMLAGEGKLEEAIEHYREALRVNPRNAATHNNLGLSLANGGKIDEAIEHYETAIRLDPRHAYAHFNLAIELAKRGRRPEAAEHIQTAIRLEPRIPGARHALESLRRAAP